MATRRALVTGGAGFIAGHLACSLLADGWTVTAFDSLLEQVHAEGRRPASLDSAVDLVVGDVRDGEAVRAVVDAGPWDLVVHLAAETGTGQSLDESTRHASVNVVERPRSSTPSLLRGPCRGISCSLPVVRSTAKASGATLLVG